jgi:Kdo2-lipid IVA lauroyltransferase/acyltransferase
LKILIKSIALIIRVIPFQLFYLASSCFLFLLLKPLKYRQKVINENLKHAFPDMPDSERDEIKGRFYMRFADMIFETIKSIGLRRKTLLKRCELEDSEATRSLVEGERGGVVLTGHFMNWEWAGLRVAAVLKKNLFVVYKPLHNQFSDALMLTIRNKFGSKAIPMSRTLKTILADTEKDRISSFLADQTPTRGEAGIWLPFFGRKVPFFTGAVKIAMKINKPLYFGYITSITRGKYEVRFKLISADPKNETVESLMKTYVSELEAAIKVQPESWLWSHRRWKHFGKKALR